jgi:hypothetical protein
MPAPAGWNVGRELGSIGASIAELVTATNRLFSTKTRDFYPTLFTRYRAPVPDFHIETIVPRGKGQCIPRAPRYNETLARFLEAA